ncbi:HIG1 domain family member 2A, mitochondrial [Tribolium castaneum]|uniref:HIG1 domain family member 2A, mitochondrial-like Protein n=1 Tax=Tribolium castaneum TaxID=7070 RepID=D6WZM3_TRICA|nr:PREDICTED: HIG1 domain family member 2A, mitochondrial [Tribolium castaneum]EFA09681.1 HIG1 domain family member 2A, mitochondrial-like Protein [Tribolium castaneum]|eukprot:XP_973213.1 PREDICTED: HIG1 domain family member 2A, mitochondrial [Tribolium castaneum]
MAQRPLEADEMEFDWIQLQKEIRAGDETRKEKLLRKIKENPMIPIGCLATTCALCYGLWSFRTGNRKMSQYMMRTRIVAQGFTVVALLAGIGTGLSKIERPKK